MAKQSSTKVSSVSIRPGVQILSVLQHLNYKPWFALAEFVDNSLQSYLKHRKEIKKLGRATSHLQVEIETSASAGGKIVVRDNAAGIYHHEFPRAFRPAELPPERTGLSEFGMGMKSAACWFAGNWSVRTLALGEAVERTVYFDIAEIVSDKVEELKVTERSAAANKHYTEIALWNLHHPPKGRTLGKIKEHLASIYRVFLREGILELSFDEEDLQYEDPRIMIAPYYKKKTGKPIRWHKQIDFRLGRRASVSGFAALRDPGSTTHAGFALMRRKRLIQGSADEPYRPIEIFGNSNSFRSQRLFGELVLEGFGVSHTKDGFQWEDEGIFLSTLRKELEKGHINLLDQAEHHRSKPERKSLQSRARDATEHVGEILKDNVPDILQEESKNPKKNLEIPETVPKSKLQASEKTVPVYDGKNNWEVTVRTSLDPGVGEWLRIAAVKPKSAKKGVRQMTIDVALDHPFVELYLGPSNENVELFLSFAVGIAIALVLAEDATGADASLVLHRFNSLLREGLSKQ